MSEIIDVSYSVVKQRPASDLPPWLEVSLRVIDALILPLFALFCLSLLIQDLAR
jgi:hypothetical protein